MIPSMDVVPVRAFKDNYIWLLASGRHAVAVDPGDARPVRAHLQRHGLTLAAILITHHHDDHTGGVAALLTDAPIPVYAPRNEAYPFAHLAVGEGELIHLPALGLVLEVLEVPGHTRGHVAYYGGNMLFCGDTLFGGGCGRVFEGRCQQLYQSLSRLAQLPDATRLYCAHEYTLANLHFAISVDPDNAALRERLMAESRKVAAGRPTLPSTLALEKATNPFLRCHIPSIQAFASQHDPLARGNPATTFCTIRRLKDDFKS